MPTLHERIAGGLWGALVGDAVGVPYEFHQPHDIPPLAEIEMIPPVGFHRAHHSVKPGTWSDDGAQALALLDSLLTCESLDLEDLGRRFVAWRTRGEYAVSHHVFDIGIQTSTAIAALQNGTPAASAGPAEGQNNGNGSLMRVVPLALWHRGDDTALVEAARRQSLVTHGHIRSQICCALYCLWARRTLQATTDPWSDAVATLRALFPSGSPERNELDFTIKPDEAPHGEGSGYVLDSLHSARLAMQAATYPDVIKAAIALGHDTDTTACIAGGIAGIRDGVDAIPERWLSVMLDRALPEALLSRLLALYP